jgi:hypothetical protein
MYNERYSIYIRRLNDLERINEEFRTVLQQKQYQTYINSSLAHPILEGTQDSMTLE